MIIQVIGNDS